MFGELVDQRLAVLHRLGVGIGALDEPGVLHVEALEHFRLGFEGKLDFGRVLLFGADLMGAKFHVELRDRRIQPVVGCFDEVCRSDWSICRCFSRYCSSIRASLFACSAASTSSSR